MFILKSFFAEPVAALRPFGNGSATGRVLALITAMASAVLMALQPVQAQQADFYATLYGSGADAKIILTFKPNLGAGRAPTDATQDQIFVFTPKYGGIKNITVHKTSDTQASSPVNVVDNDNISAPSTSGITTTGAASFATQLPADTTRIMIELDNGHSFRRGDIMTVVSAKLNAAEDGFDGDDWKVQFAAGLEWLDWGVDETRYTLGIPNNESDAAFADYALNGVPDGSNGIGDVSYSFHANSTINSDNDIAHISGRNILRVSGILSAASLIPISPCNAHRCLSRYTATDGNGASIERIISVFVVEQLHSDDVDSGIPTLQQQVEGGVAVYAKEMFGADSTNLVLRRGKYGSIELGADGITPSSGDPTGYFVLQFRKPVDTENSGEITLTLNGAALGDVMAPSHVKVLKGVGGTEIPNVAVQRRSGGNVGDSQAVFLVSTGSSNNINIGDYIRFEIPALMGTNLGNDGEMVFISASVSSVSKSGSNYFPDGANGISKCLSDRIAGARECIFVKAEQAVSFGDGNKVQGFEMRGKININDRTRAAGPETGTPNQSVTLTPAVVPGLRANRSANVFDLGRAHISLVYGTQASVRERGATKAPSAADEKYVPIFDASGEIFAANSISPNDFFHLRASPTPAHGALMVAKYENGAYDIRASVQQATYQGRLVDVQNLSGGSEGKKTLVKSLLYVPSGAIDSTGATSLEHGEIYNMTASVDFNNASYEDKASNPNTTTFELSSVQSMAIAYAIPPPSSPDDAFIRIRCEESAGCNVSLRCSNQTGATWFGELAGRVDQYATEVLTAEEIADILSGEGFDAARHWGGPANGRLSCEVLTLGGKVSTQVLVRSGGILTNNTNVSMGGAP